MKTDTSKPSPDEVCSLESSAAQWDEQAAIFKAKGNLEMAKSCGGAATSLRMQAKDGIARCSCCLKPYASHGPSNS